MDDRANQNLQRRNAMLAVLSESLARFIESSHGVIDYQYKADQLRHLTNAVVTLVHSYDDRTGLATTRGFSCAAGSVDRLIKLLGFNPVGRTWTIQDDCRNESKFGHLVRVKSVYDLAQGQLPRSLTVLTEKMLRVGPIYEMGLYRQGRLLGNAIIILPAGTDLEEADIVELYIRQVAAIILWRQAERDWLEGQKGYRSLFEHSRDGLLVTAPDGQCLRANPEAGRMLGLDRTNLLPMPIRDLLLEGSEDPLSMLAEKGAFFGEVVLQTQDGYRHVEINATVLPDGNHLLALRDVEERKLTEQQMGRLEQLNVVGEMAAGIAHEIRNPMTAARGLIQLMGEKDQYVNDKPLFDLIIQEIDRANTIISEFLSLARSKPAEKQLLNLNLILESLLPLLQAEATKGNHTIDTKLGDIPDLPLNGGETRQLILNMVRNGLESMSHQGTLTIKTFRDQDDVVLAFQDQGSGIDPAVLTKLGTPFLTTRNHGTGLGLTVCYGIARRHNATITVDTTPHGTTFSIRFIRE